MIYGFNIAILIGILLAVSKPFFRPQWSSWFVLAGVGLYTVLVGADAAVVRAAIMGAIFVIAAPHRGAHRAGLPLPRPAACNRRVVHNALAA